MLASHALCTSEPAVIGLVFICNDPHRHITACRERPLHGRHSLRPCRAKWTPHCCGMKPSERSSCEDHQLLMRLPSGQPASDQSGEQSQQQRLTCRLVSAPSWLRKSAACSRLRCTVETELASPCDLMPTLHDAVADTFNEQAFLEAMTVVLAHALYLPAAQCFALVRCHPQATPCMIQLIAQSSARGFQMSSETGIACSSGMSGGK